jgi:3-deoxy-D-manno-octulosonic-acid transferase
MRLLLLLAALTLSPHNNTIRIAVTGDTGDGAETVATAIAQVHASSPIDGIILTGPRHPERGNGERANVARNDTPPSS